MRAQRTARIWQDGDAREVRLPADSPASPATVWLPAATGTVIGALLNFRDALDALGDAVNQKPYLRAPQAPILYIKPANTLNSHRARIVVPRGVESLEMGATLGIVIGRRATRVAAEDALDVIAGYTVVNDVSVPHDSYYRPAVRHKCRDGFCPIGPWVLARDAVANPDALSIVVRINGEQRLSARTSDLVRPVAQLIAEVTDFMTLSPGDVLCVGVPANAPRARAGDVVEVDIAGVGCLENTLVAEEEAQ